MTASDARRTRPPRAPLGLPRRRPGGPPAPLPAPLAALAAAAYGAAHAYQVYHPPLPAGRARTPAARGLPVRTRTVTASRDGIPLRAWVVPGAGPHTVVVCHGMGRTKATVLGHIELLHRAGHHVVAYDLRNHGESGRDRAWRDMGERFTRDLEDVLAAVAADPALAGGSLAVLGFSFSTWPALVAAARSRVPVAAVVAEGGPGFDVAGGFGHFAALRGRTLPAALLTPRSLAAYQRAFRRAALRMLGAAGWPPDPGSVPARVMFIAGAHDAVVRPAEVERTARHYPGAEFWVAPNATHLSGLRFDTAEYERRVLGFLAEAFEAAGAAGGPYGRHRPYWAVPESITTGDDRP
ncbi:alpha/beta fold hydrolase [Streptomyces sp. B1866]|uniref:alpha/beta hydrolase n=1 Tax=Streptomyces sp. B1866 TaxID=3075431 RepID=UPI00288CBEE1|nr:alpha/beta fold hydrolase [Streptomyces sp. B1866]MDT3399151.1 alpha/beta fold hydrolase [Streptomyces sp. B1866]